LPAIRPGVGVGAPVAHGAGGEAVGSIEGIRRDDRTAQWCSAGHCHAVAGCVILVGKSFARRVLGGDQAIERVVGVADLARDAAAGLRDVRAVAGGVQGVGVAGEEVAVVGVRQGGQAAGGIEDRFA